MALTVTAFEIDAIGTGTPTTSGTYDRGTMGLYVGVQFDVSSTVSLAGQNLHFHPALFRDSSQAELPIIGPPEFGFVTSYPSSGYPVSQVMTGLPTPRSFQGNNISAVLTANSSTDFTVVYLYLQTYDLNDFVTDTGSPKETRFTKNNVFAPDILVNDTLAVYNTPRALRSAFVTDDLAGGIDGIYYDIDVSSRWYEQGLLGGASEFENWTYKLTRNGLPVSNLSTTETTTITFTVDLGSVPQISPENHFLAYREDSPQTGLGFVNDLDVGYYSNAVKLLGKTAITTHSGWSLVSGTTYEMSYDIDPTYLVLNGQYRFIAIAFEGPTGVDGLSNSFITPVVIVADAPPKAVTGTMTGGISDFNDIFGDCLEVTAMERIRCCVQVDKASYDAEVITNSAQGTFDSNFDNVRVTVTALTGTLGTVIDVNSSVGGGDLTIEDNASFYESCLTFRLQPEWTNTPFAVDHVYTYNLINPTDGVGYQDIVTYRQVVNADKLEEDETVANQIITDIVFKDSGGNVLTELCDDYSDPITVEVTKNATIDDYNLIALIRRDIAGETPEEQEDYDNNILPELTSDIIDSVDVQFVANLATFEIDPGKLDRGQKYRVFAVAKKVNLSPPVDCPIITIQTDTEVTSTGLVGPDEVTTLGIDFAITNFGPSTVTNVDINTTVSGVNVTGPNQNDNFVTDTGSYVYIVTFTNGFRGVPADLQLVIDVTLSNGCTYTGRINTHGIIPILGNQTTDTTVENGD